MLVKFWYIKCRGLKRTAQEQEQSSVQGATDVRAGKRTLGENIAIATGSQVDSLDGTDVKAENEELSELMAWKNKMRLAIKMRWCMHLCM